ncbi:CBO0543 family protein [Cohnella sp. GCM10020058]|uniref:CBO0543 family protein n=1 Tax=Cohnella sp. GCM10020058 TaxID=3317330 RepID=UPI003645D62F
MTMERFILIGVWIITILLLRFSVPLNKIREAFVIFSFKQMLTWFFGFLVVQYKLIEYPVREFPYAARNSFSFEYFIYPALCCVFNMKFPDHKGILHKTLWYLFFPSWMTILEVLIEKHTQLIRYLHWHWYWTWITLLATFFVSRMFYLWFIKVQTGGTSTMLIKLEADTGPKDR